MRATFSNGQTLICKHVPTSISSEFPETVFSDELRAEWADWYRRKFAVEIGVMRFLDGCHGLTSRVLIEFKSGDDYLMISESLSGESLRRVWASMSKEIKVRTEVVSTSYRTNTLVRLLQSNHMLLP
jgi:hypothetical protein